MYHVSFQLNTPKAEESIILMICTYDSLRCKISTKTKIPVKFWNKSAQSAKSTIYFRDAEKVNNELFAQRKTLGTVFADFLEHFERKPSPKELSAAFKAAYFDDNPLFNAGKVKTFPEVLDEYIKTMNVEGKGKSAEKYTQVKANLLEFCKLYNKPLAFEAINMDFRADLLDYFNSVKGFRQTTIHRKMKFIKTIILYALNNGYVKLDKLNINLTKWGVSDGDAENIALSPEELKEIEELDLSDYPSLDRARDRFLIGCYTGARFSDFIRLSKHHIKMVDGKQYISFRQEKTGETVTQPFWPDLRKIFEKYDYDLPKPISNQNFNNFLFEIASKCKLLQKQMEISDFQNGRKVNKIVTRAELISAHTARRTFATIYANKGVDLEVIALGTGHKSITQLKNYIKINDIQKANIMENAFSKI